MRTLAVGAGVAAAALLLVIALKGSPKDTKPDLYSDSGSHETEGEALGQAPGSEPDETSSRDATDIPVVLATEPDPVPRIRSVEIVLDDVRDAWALRGNERTAALANAMHEVERFIATDEMLLRLERGIPKVRIPKVRAVAVLAIAARRDTLAERALARLTKSLWTRSEVERHALLYAATRDKEGADRSHLTVANLGELKVFVGGPRETTDLRDALRAQLATAPALQITTTLRAWFDGLDASTRGWLDLPPRSVTTDGTTSEGPTAMDDVPRALENLRR